LFCGFSIIILIFLALNHSIQSLDSPVKNPEHVVVLLTRPGNNRTIWFNKFLITIPTAKISCLYKSDQPKDWSPTWKVNGTVVFSHSKGTEIFIWILNAYTNSCLKSTLSCHNFCALCTQVVWLIHLWVTTAWNCC